MREIRTYGSVRGVWSNPHPYRDTHPLGIRCYLSLKKDTRKNSWSSGEGLTGELKLSVFCPPLTSERPHAVAFRSLGLSIAWTF